MDDFAKLREFLTKEACKEGADYQLIMASFVKVLPILPCMKPDSGNVDRLYEPRPYEPQDGSDVRLAIAALTSAFGEAVQRVNMVSSGSFLPQPIWMDEETYDEIRDIAWGHLCEGALGPKVEQFLDSVFKDKVDTDNDGVIELADVLNDIQLDSTNDVLREVLLYYLSLAIVGDNESVARLTPLVELLPYHLPLGEKSEESGTWIVLTA